MTPINTSANRTVLQALLIQVKSRNKLLYYFGCINFVLALTCGIAVAVSDVSVLGINAWIKPAKFFLSIGLLSVTMAWYMVYLSSQQAVKRYSWVLVLALSIENIIIASQAARGQLSHFNISSALNGFLFSFMGIIITIFTLWTAYIGVLFFRQKDFPPHLPPGYIWGIRLGLLLFVLFAFEGGQMAARLAHTVGALDGGEGLPLLNWSKTNGDLRVPHFFGMHALQVLPLAGYYFAKTKTSIILLTIGWLLFTSLLYWQAILGYPLWPN